MTVATTTNKAIATGNGVTTTFPFTFGTLPTADLVVTLFDLLGVADVQTEGADFTILGEGSEDGGAVVFSVPPPNLYTVLIQRIVPETQPTDIKNQGSFYPRTIERMFDRLVYIIQQLSERVVASLTLPAQITGVSTELPVPEENTLFGWNSDKTAITNFPLSSIATSIVYGDKTYQTFVGDGVAVNFGLGSDPASLGNLDISIDGVVQVPGADFTYSGTVLTFTVAPANGAVILVRYDQAVPVGSAISSAVTFQNSGSGAAVRSVQARERDTLHAADFGVVGDNLTDNSAGLENVIAEAASRKGASILLPSGVIRHTLPIVITTSGVMLEGSGVDATHDGGTLTVPGTVLYYTGGAAVDQVMFTSPAGASSQKRTGGGLKNLWLDGNATATRALVVRSWTKGKFENLFIQGHTTVGVQLDVISGSLAEAKDTRNNVFERVDVTVTGAAHGWLLDGDAVANTCFNNFTNCGARHQNGNAWHLNNSDNNLMITCGGFRTGGGTGLTLILNGANVGNGPSRSNTFLHFSGNGGVTSKGTASFTTAAYSNTILYYDTDNGSPAPTIEAGSQLCWNTDTAITYFGAQVKSVIANTAAGVVAGRAAINNESVLIHNNAQSHVTLTDGTNPWQITLDASGNFRLSGPAGKFIVPFKHTYHAASGSLAWDPGARTASATTGASGAPPAQVAGYLTQYLQDGTTVIKVPYYNA